MKIFLSGFLVFFIGAIILSCQPKFISTKYDFELPASKHAIQKKANTSFSFYSFKNNETIVSVGAMSCMTEIYFALQRQNLNFYLENILSKHLNDSVFQFTKNHFEKLYHKQLNSNFHLVIGNDSSTTLPKSIADKVIVENSFHEFSLPQKMFQDFYKILKPNGKLYFNEYLRTSKYTVHSGCKKRLFSQEEIIEIASQNHFDFKRIQNDLLIDDNGNISQLIEFEKN